MTGMLLRRLYRYRWYLAFALSLLIHVFFISGLRMQWPDMDDSPQVIEAHITPMAAAPLPPVQAPAPKPKAINRRPALQPAIAPVTTSAEAGPGSVQAANPVSSPPLPPLPFESGVDLDSSYQFEETPSLPPPKWVETDYEVKRVGSFGSGRARFRYQTEWNKQQLAYQIRSEMEASGLASLAFSGKRLESSEGLVTEQGLKPQFYRYDLSNKVDRLSTAEFDWINNQLTLKNSKETRTYPLQSGTLDMVSFLYQFMFVGPLDIMRYTITNGRTVKEYEYQFLAEETIASPLGDLKTLHIAKSSGDPEEKTEVWLASDYRYIPVKIVRIAKDGTGYAFLVTRIQADFTHEH